MVRRVVVVLVALGLIAGAWMSTAVASERATIRVWYAGTDRFMMDVVNNQLIPEFEGANPDIDVVVEFVPWGDMSTKLATAFAAGVAPDLFMHGQAATAGFAAGDQIEPLDRFLETMPDASDFGLTLDAGKYFGSRYMMPMFGSGWLLLYRADQFREVGLDPTVPPATWEDLLEAAKRLTVWSGSRLVREGLDLPSTGVNPPQIWANFLWQNGGDFFTPDFTDVAFHSSEGREALQYIVDLIHVHKTTDTQVNMGRGNVPPLATGEIAMLFGVPGDVANVKTYAPQVYPEVRVAPPLRRKEQVALYAFNGFFMSKSSQHKDKAWRLLEYLASPSAMEKFVRTLQAIPPRQSLASSDYVATDPALRVYVEGARYARGNPNVPEWVRVRDTLSRYLEQAMYGVMSPADALNRAASEARRFLSTP
ncbi:MAG TPA: ABC transporter substrate-binding protein [Limnochordales bacterium]